MSNITTLVLRTMNINICTSFINFLHILQSVLRKMGRKKEKEKINVLNDKLIMILRVNTTRNLVFATITFFFKHVFLRVCVLRLQKGNL